jgi:hypothetical protein
MNILEQEDLIKGLPDAALMQEASAPSGEVPQFLIVSEIKRRSDMRKRYDQQEQQEQGTVKDQILAEAMGGIAPMMPTAMTPPAQPMGPAGPPPNGAMPPQMGGMPPQGMPPMAPPMPQGGIASAPQAMPPMGMAQGGAVKMQTGGITSMPGSGALYGMQKEYIDPLLDKAQILARTAGISIEEAYQALVRQAQMNMPDYSMIAPAGMGEMPSLEGADKAVGDAIGSAYGLIPQYSSRDYLGEVGSAAGEIARQSQMNRPNYSMIAPAGMGEMPSIDVDLGMPTRRQAQAADRAAVESIRSGLSPSITAGDIDSAVAGMVTERAPRSGGFSGITSLFSGITDRIGELSDELGITGVDSDAKRRARIAKNLEERPIGTSAGFSGFTAPSATYGTFAEAFDSGSSIINDAQVQAKTDATVQSTGQNKPQANQNITPATDGTEPSLVASAVDAVADLQSGSGPADQRASTPDDGLYSGAISSIDQMIADLSGREAQASPVLDLSDVIERSQKDTLAETFMRLGAGVAGGDISKGISGAADAASKGRQELSRLEMAERIAQTKAGQEDIRRGEQRDLDVAKLGLQREQLNILATRYKNELEKAASVGRNELFRTASAVIDAAMDGSMITDPAERQAKVYELMNEFLTLYAPTFGVTNLPKLPTGGSGAGSSDPLGIRGTP